MTGWRKDLPDDEVLVLLRMECEDSPLALGWHEDGGWLCSASDVETPVRGWMHVRDAAEALDALGVTVAGNFSNCADGGPVDARRRQASGRAAARA